MARTKVFLSIGICSLILAAFPWVGVFMGLNIFNKVDLGTDFLFAFFTVVLTVFGAMLIGRAVTSRDGGKK